MYKIFIKNSAISNKFVELGESNSIRELISVGWNLPKIYEVLIYDTSTNESFDIDKHFKHYGIPA